VIRSQLGRADPVLAEKADRLVGVTPERSWAGPEPAPVPPRDMPGPARVTRRGRAARDSVVSLVLSVHAVADQPLGFEQVVS